MPNRLAVWLLKISIPSDQFEPVMGDLLEEFTGRVTATDVSRARRWFWRQTGKTIAQFLAAQCRDRPAVNIAIVLVALPLLFYSRMAASLAATAILSKYNVYHYLSAYAFWFVYDIVIGSTLTPLLIGWFSAAMAKGREMAVTVTVALLGTIPFFSWVLFFVHQEQFLQTQQISPWMFFKPVVLPTLLVPVAALLGGTFRQLSRGRARIQLPG